MYVIPKELELSNKSSPRRLDLAVHHIQGSMGLARLSDPRSLDLAFIQFQDVWTWQRTTSKVAWVWHACQIQGAWTWH
jgi:hypothetical protein